MYSSPHAEAFAARKRAHGNTKHAMFGLLKVLAAIFYVIEDSTFKTRRDTTRVAALKRVGRCVQNQKGGFKRRLCRFARFFGSLNRSVVFLPFRNRSNFV